MKNASSKSQQAVSAAIEKLQQVYATDHGKKFVNHLINSFLDPNQTVVSQHGDDNNNCAITKKKLIGYVGILQLVSNDEMKKIVSFITQIGLDNDLLNQPHQEVYELVLQKLDDTEPLITSTQSSKHLSLTGYMALLLFVKNEVKNNNQQIKAMVNFIAKKQKTKHYEK